MTPVGAALRAHLATGATTLCRAWRIRRRDGRAFGFTDHDCDLRFEDLVFKAGTGLTARRLAQSTGLSVDNSEALGALSDAAVTEADIDAGRFDRAEVTGWLVNWAAPEQREVLFQGHLGEIRRSGGAFEAELRGLTEALNQPQGRLFQRLCPAVLGDGDCGVDLDQEGFRLETNIAEVQEARQFFWPAPALEAYALNWFTGGRLDVLSGAGAGLWASIKGDDLRTADPSVLPESLDDHGVTRREISLWHPLQAALRAGDRIALTTGCDKRFATCRGKFANLANFRGFPDIPGEDWLTAVPRNSHVNSGGSRR